jgi:hypothetical protein
VEKNGIINNFKQNMAAKDHEVENLQKVIEQVIHPEMTKHYC